MIQAAVETHPRDREALMRKRLARAGAVAPESAYSIADAVEWIKQVLDAKEQQEIQGACGLVAILAADRHVKQIPTVVEHTEYMNRLSAAREQRLRHGERITHSDTGEVTRDLTNGRMVLLDGVNLFPGKRGEDQFLEALLGGNPEAAVKELVGQFSDEQICEMTAQSRDEITGRELTGVLLRKSIPKSRWTMILEKITGRRAESISHALVALPDREVFPVGQSENLTNGERHHAVVDIWLASRQSSNRDLPGVNYYTASEILDHVARPVVDAKGRKHTPKTELGLLMSKK